MRQPGQSGKISAGYEKQRCEKISRCCGCGRRTMSAKSLGILGGTFDPIHNGHLHMARAVCERMAMDEIIFIPAHVPPHKQHFASAADRYAMTALAIAGEPRFLLSDMEIRRSGISYTIDTIRELHEAYAGRELYFIIGMDSVAQLHTWHHIEEMLELSSFAAIWRSGYENALRELEAHLGARALERVLLLNTPVYDVSSTEIRSRVRRRASLAGLVPRAVEKYIYEHGLYTGD